MLTGGAYSQKFKDLEQQRLDKLNGSTTMTASEGLSHAQQLAARDKVRQLSLETNRRRRAQELKRRLEAQKEAKRRQEVLEERRKRQQEATQRYQRLQKGSPKTERASSGKSYNDSRLQDGLNVARGYSRPVTLNTGNHSNLAPALEEALRMVGVNTAPASTTSYRGGGYGGEPDYTTGHRGGYSDPYNPVDYVGDIPFRRQAVDDNGNSVIENKGQSYHGYATPATATYNRNSNRDAVGTPYQQTLHENQRQLMEQQQAALHEFNQAVLNEALPSQGEELQRSGSVLSLDSLEEEQQSSQKPLGYDSRKKTPAGGTSASVHGNGKAKTNDEYSSKAGVHPSSIQTRSAYGNIDSKPKEFNYSGRSAISDNRLFTSNTESHRPNGPQSGGFSNGELLVEETSESDFVRDPVDNKPALLQGSMQQPPYLARTSQAWVSQAPSDATQFHDASQSQGMYATGPVSTQAGQRPFSARTTATAVTNYPARIPDSPIDYNHHKAQQRSEHVSGKPSIPATVPNRAFSTVLANARYNSANGDMGSKHSDLDINQIKAKYGDASHFREHSSRNDSQSTEKQLQVNSTKAHGKTDTSEKAVRSILKRGHGTGLMSQKVKLGVMKVKDSIEISRATQVTKTDRKSVRWTDMRYADDAEEKARSEEHETVLEKSEASRAEKPKPAPPRPADDSAKVHMNGKRRTASAGTQPRRPTLLPRMMPHNPSKPPLGRSNPGSPGKQVEPENPPRGSGKGTQESNKYTPAHTEDGRVYQNGIRLDKTPTDDEINWLWDKVRTCLHTQEQDQVSDTSSNRQLATVSKQSIDGNRLTANLRVSTQSATNPAGHAPDHPLTHQQKYNTYPRLRTNSASSAASLRKTALLQQRRQHSAAVGNLRPGYQGRNHQQYTGPVPGFQPSPPSNNNHHPGPMVSNQGPTRTAAGHTQGHGQEVSDSLLAFQQAERLAQENLTETEMAAALEEQKNHTYMQKVPASALSMEEQRILESLDKLNAQLRTVSSDTNAAMQPYMMIQPKPPPQGSGYRSHRPLSCRQRAVSDGNVSLRTRTLSADRSNARINYRH